MSIRQHTSFDVFLNNSFPLHFSQPGQRISPTFPPFAILLLLYTQIIIPRPNVLPSSLNDSPPLPVNDRLLMRALPTSKISELSVAKKKKEFARARENLAAAMHCAHDERPAGAAAAVHPMRKRRRESYIRLTSRLVTSGLFP